MLPGGVIRMLPGGVTILGVYIVTKEDPFASPIPVRQTIGAITKAVDEAHLDMIKLEIDPIVIHVHASSGK
ncbi:hypothetical protein QYM36_015864 [Artemia franciscana]|uniref:Uncharacterized protein n=1 Tax=Artemia franciscana TaxID=6661 RepID=A0AA88L2R0_ARTSF|nr:hypothetical protein QYM36_015864 [Artemia franciscana]